MCDPQGKTPFLAFPEPKKGVVNYARLRKAAHWPNNNADLSGLLEKKVYCVERCDMCDPQGKNPILHIAPFYTINFFF